LNTINPLSREAMRERAAPGRAALHRSILLWIEAFKDKHGYAPTMREIAEGVGYAAASPVDYQLRLMQEEQLITRIPHVSRTIAITKRGHALMREKKLPSLENLGETG
jgi:SOS-response transcriptional repressor LexA